MKNIYAMLKTDAGAGKYERVWIGMVNSGDENCDRMNLEMMAARNADMAGLEFFEVEFTPPNSGQN